MYICLYFYSERRTRQKEGITTKLNAGSWNRNRKWSTASVPRKRQSLSWNYWNMSYLQAYLRLFRKNAAVKDDFTAFIYSDQPGFWIRTINRNTSGHKWKSAFFYQSVVEKMPNLLSWLLSAFRYTIIIFSLVEMSYKFNLPPSHSIFNSVTKEEVYSGSGARSYEGRLVNLSNQSTFLQLSAKFCFV